MYSNNKDRRQYERVATERPVTLISQGLPEMDGKMIDLSVKGAGIVLHDNCLTSKDLQLSFMLPAQTAKPITVSAHIAHSTPVRGDCLLGLEFTDISDAQMAAINEFIRFHHRLD